LVGSVPRHEWPGTLRRHELGSFPDRSCHRCCVAFVAVLITEAVFDDTINWVAVVLVPVATVIGIIIGDAVRSSRN